MLIKLNLQKNSGKHGRRPLLWGVGALSLNLFSATSLLAQGMVAFCFCPVHGLLCYRFLTEGMPFATCFTFALFFYAMSAGIPKNYEVFVDKVDGYSYLYPSDWRVKYMRRIFKNQQLLLFWQQRNSPSKW